MPSSLPTDDVLLHGKVKASYFWDDGSGINGDTGPPASGKPMQKGLFAAPSWPLGTKGYVVYEARPPSSSSATAAPATRRRDAT